MTFYISSGPASPVDDIDLPYVDRIAVWWHNTLNNLRTSSPRDWPAYLETQWHETKEKCTRLFYKLTNQRVPTKLLPSTKEVVMHGQEEPNKGWRFAGIFNNLRKSRTIPQEEPSLKQWDEGEVHADLIRNSDGRFVWRYLLVDIPSEFYFHREREFVKHLPLLQTLECRNLPVFLLRRQIVSRITSQFCFSIAESLSPETPPTVAYLSPSRHICTTRLIIIENPILLHLYKQLRVSRFRPSRMLRPVT